MDSEFFVFIDVLFTSVVGATPPVVVISVIGAILSVLGTGILPNRDAVPTADEQAFTTTINLVAGTLTAILAALKAATGFLVFLVGATIDTAKAFFIGSTGPLLVLLGVLGLGITAASQWWLGGAVSDQQLEQRIAATNVFAWCAGGSPGGANGACTSSPPTN